MTMTDKNKSQKSKHDGLLYLPEKSWERYAEYIRLIANEYSGRENYQFNEPAPPESMVEKMLEALNKTPEYFRMPNLPGEEKHPSCGIRIPTPEVKTSPGEEELAEYEEMSIPSFTIEGDEKVVPHAQEKVITRTIKVIAHIRE